MITLGFAATASAECYVQQLNKHWSHKFATTYADGVGVVPFGAEAHAALWVQPDGVAIRLHTIDKAGAERMRQVIASHLDRFAFREAPLNFTWESGQ